MKRIIVLGCCIIFLFTISLHNVFAEKDLPLLSIDIYANGTFHVLVRPLQFSEKDQAKKKNIKVSIYSKKALDNLYQNGTPITPIMYWGDDSIDPYYMRYPMDDGIHYPDENAPEFNDGPYAYKPDCGLRPGKYYVDIRGYYGIIAGPLEFEIPEFFGTDAYHLSVDIHEGGYFTIKREGELPEPQEDLQFQDENIIKIYSEEAIHNIYQDGVKPLMYLYCSREGGVSFTHYTINLNKNYYPDENAPEFNDGPYEYKPDCGLRPGKYYALITDPNEGKITDEPLEFEIPEDFVEDTPLLSVDVHEEGTFTVIVGMLPKPDKKMGDNRINIYSKEELVDLNQNGTSIEPIMYWYSPYYYDRITYKTYPYDVNPDIYYPDMNAPEFNDGNPFCGLRPGKYYVVANDYKGERIADPLEFEIPGAVTTPMPTEPPETSTPTAAASTKTAIKTTVPTVTATPSAAANHSVTDRNNMILWICIGAAILGIIVGITAVMIYKKKK